ncbi:MAG TPA: hypothetical protein VFJ58_03735 [Armatimonadota bacterium]|nr:hypothetical protein [Armatimonadota bacterium]
MKNTIRAFAAAACAMAGIFASSMAMGSTISKNVPGAIRHPVNQAAIAVGADQPHHRHTTHQRSRHTTHQRSRHTTHQRSRHTTYRTRYSRVHKSSTHRRRIHRVRHHS